MPSLRSSILLALTLVGFSSAIDNLEERQQPEPVANDCSIQVIDVNTPGSWSVSNAFYKQHIVDVIPQQGPTTASGINNAQQQCTEICYGFGESCVSSLWAESIPPTAFGASSGPSTACYLFNTTIGSNDLMTQPKTAFTNVYASNLFCDDGCPS